MQVKYQLVMWLVAHGVLQKPTGARVALLPRSKRHACRFVDFTVGEQGVDFCVNP